MWKFYLQYISLYPHVCLWNVWSIVMCIFLKVYFTWKAEWKGQWNKSVCCWFTPRNGRDPYGLLFWLGLDQSTSGNWNSFCISHMGGRSLSTCTVCCCLPRCIYGKLDWKWTNSRGFNGHSEMGCWHAGSSLMYCAASLVLCILWTSFFCKRIPHINSVLCHLTTGIPCLRNVPLRQLYVWTL